MAIDAVIGGVQGAPAEPLDQSLVKIIVQHPLPGFKPGQILLGLLRPENFRRFNGTPIEALVFGQTLDVGCLFEFGEVGSEKIGFIRHWDLLRKIGGCSKKSIPERLSVSTPDKYG